MYRPLQLLSPAPNLMVHSDHLVIPPRVDHGGPVLDRSRDWLPHVERDPETEWYSRRGESADEMVGPDLVGCGSTRRGVSAEWRKDRALTGQALRRHRQDLLGLDEIS